MTNEEAIANLKMISVAFVEPITKEQRKLINDTFDMAIEALEQEPKTGHWIKDNPFTKPYCSECKTSCIGLHGFDYTLTNFCPNCGADMRGEV